MDRLISHGSTVELQTTTVGLALPHVEVDSPEASAESIGEDGFMCSGDLARIDENGYVSSCASSSRAGSPATRFLPICASWTRSR